MKLTDLIYAWGRRFIYHLRAFHKFKSYSSHIKKHLTFNCMYTKTNLKKHLKKSKNSTFGITLVYYSNKAAGTIDLSVQFMNTSLQRHVKK